MTYVLLFSKYEFDVIAFISSNKSDCICYFQGFNDNNNLPTTTTTTTNNNNNNNNNAKLLYTQPEYAVSV